MRVTGDGFLRHMVRNLMGTLVEVGAGRWDRGARSRSSSHDPAPRAAGLRHRAVCF